MKTLKSSKTKEPTTPHSKNSHTKLMKLWSALDAMAEEGNITIRLFWCNKCSPAVTYTTRQALCRHRRSVHRDVYTTRQALCSHRRIVHQAVFTTRCDFCQNSFTRRDSLMRHLHSNNICSAMYELHINMMQVSSSYEE